MKSAYYKSKLGLLQMKYEENTLYLLKKVSNQTEENQPCPFTDDIFKQIQEYLRGEKKNFDINYSFIGSDFQKKVWHEIEKIPYGKTITYGEIASSIGNPKASRGVGGACNKNPICIVVPCHRVIGKNGSLTGYGGGLEMKEYLLSLEEENLS